MTSFPQDGGKVLLVNYAGYFLTANTFVPDNSLASLAAALRRSGVDVEIVDFQSPQWVGRVMDGTERARAGAIVEALDAGQRPPVELIRAYHEDRRHGEREALRACMDELTAAVARDRVRLVGFKLWAGEGIRGALALAQAVKEGFPGVRLVAGGPAVQYAGSVLDRLTKVFDELVVGDGEDAIVRLATGRAMPVPVSAGKGAALDRMPMPTYDPEVYRDIDGFFRVRLLDESRGCFNRCAFCSHPHLNGTQVRERTPERVVDEIERTVRQDGIRHFRLSGSNPRWDLVRAIGAELLRRRLDVRWSVYSSMNNVRPNDLGWLAGSGLCSLFFGIESGDEELLRRAHHKRNRGADHVVDVCEMAMANNIFVSLSFIVPSPGETAASRSTTVRLVDRIFARYRYGSALVMPALLAPGSTWWEHPERFGFQLEDGLDRESYVQRGLTLSNDFLLPRDCWSDYGYSLDGKRAPELLGECEDFTREVAALGVLTNVDDTAFMLADLGGLAPAEHKARVSRALITGGTEQLTAYVRRLNRDGLAAPPRFLPTGDHAERTAIHARAE